MNRIIFARCRTSFTLESEDLVTERNSSIPAGKQVCRLFWVRGAIYSSTQKAVMATRKTILTDSWMVWSIILFLNFELKSLTELHVITWMLKSFISPPPLSKYPFSSLMVLHNSNRVMFKGHNPSMNDPFGQQRPFPVHPNFLLQLPESLF